MIDDPTDKTLGEITIEVATEVVVQEGDTEVQKYHRPEKEI